MCICVSVCVCARERECAHVHPCVCMCVCKCTWRCMGECMCVHVCLCGCVLCLCQCVCLWVSCICVCANVCVCQSRSRNKIFLVCKGKNNVFKSWLFCLAHSLLASCQSTPPFFYDAIMEWTLVILHCIKFHFDLLYLLSIFHSMQVQQVSHWMHLLLSSEYLWCLLYPVRAGWSVAGLWSRSQSIMLSFTFQYSRNRWHCSIPFASHGPCSSQYFFPINIFVTTHFTVCCTDNCEGRVTDSIQDS